MDGLISASQSASHGNPTVNHSPRPSQYIRPDDPRNQSSAGTQKENRAPMSLPTALNSMLKTTTETGYTGQFASKPSRLPPLRKPIDMRNDYLSQRHQQTFQLQNEQQVVDDRRRLPSYARDATSEIVSLYETASQKSSSRPRAFETPDRRSYSMTQTSYSSNALSNHRSYTSLRSQPELGLLPRPRSPFLYPARLKRLGFRPSSAIPSEAGRADSSQDTEPERMPYAAGIVPRSSSPLSAYNKGVPLPGAVHLDSNNTYPSTLGRLPSGSRSYSPSLKSTNGSMQDWSFRPELASTKASPAGNNFRSISTPVDYHRRSPNSVTGSTSKSHTPSPLYYDYTEDFNITETTTGVAATENIPSSIPFIPSNAIHESRETATEASPQYESSPQGSSTSVDFRALATSSNADSLESSDDKPRVNSEDGHTERSTNVTQDIIPLYLDRRPYNTITADPIDNNNFPRPDKFSIAVEGGLPASRVTGNGFNPTHLDAVDGTNHNLNINQSPEDKQSLDQKHRNEETSASDRTPSFRLSTYLPIFPKPPDGTLQMNTDGDLTTRHETPARLLLDTISIQKTRKSAIQTASEGLEHGDHHHPTTRTSRPHLDLRTGGIERSVTTHDRRIRSSRYYSIDHGLSDLAQLISNFEFANGAFMFQDIYTPSAEVMAPLSLQPFSTSRLPEVSFISPTKALLQLDTPLDSRTPISKFRSDGDLRASSSSTFQARNHALHERLVNLENYGDGGEGALSFSKNSNGPVSKSPLSHPEPPLLAPKAVSPARVLRLKNSVPQLMKALPPVPRNSAFESLLPQESSHRHVTSISGPTDLMHKESSADIERIPLEGTSFHSIPSQQDLEDIIEPEKVHSPHPKFRIKSSIFDAQRSHSSANSRPWNLDDNYPWHSQQPTIRLSSLRSMIPGSQRGPKFKLRVTRASISPSGTIRINPEARSSLDLQSPKDLFTSSSNLSGIFRQVSRQFASRKSSAVLRTVPRNSIKAPSTVASNQGNGSHGYSSDLLRPPLSPTMEYPASPTEVRSFFSEDSSQIRGYNSLRKRISNLRARIPNAYTSRPAAHLNDDEAWRGNITRCAPAKCRSRAIIDSEQEDEYGMPITSMQRRRLRSKVSKWLKDAGLAMRRRVKLHNSADVHCIPYR